NQSDMSSAEFSLYLAECSVENLLTPGNDGDPVAHPFCLFHDVRGEEHSPPLAGDFDHHVFHELAVHRIQAAHGLIEDGQFGFAQPCADELNLLLHSLGEILNLFPGPIPQAQPLEPGPSATHTVDTTESPDLPQEGQVIQDPHLPVESPFFRQISDPC